VHRFLIILTGTAPLVWRRIQVPERYSFWDLHVAIQDPMGWLDYHLHEFRLVDAREKGVVSIGIPTDEDPEYRPVVPGWEIRLSRFFERRAWHAPPATYAYDCGDDSRSSRSSTRSISSLRSQVIDVLRPAGPET
jgi:hypothetical protein